MTQSDELERLKALRALKILDTAPSESFDRITRMAGHVLAAPIAAVSLTDVDRQWFKSRVGVEHWSIPRDKAPCSEVAVSTDLVVIPDMLADPRYMDSPLAASGVRFYAGAPLVTEHGFGLGAICVLDVKPRSFCAADRARLTDFAAIVMSQIELQRAFGRIDPVSGLPNRLQFADDLADLARSAPKGEKRYLVLTDIATNEQLDEVVRVAGPGYIDELLIEAAQKISEPIGPTRQAYQVGATQIAFLSPPDVVDDPSYLALIRRTLADLRGDAASRFVTTSAVGLSSFELCDGSLTDLLRKAHSAAKDARASDTPVMVYSADVDALHHRRFALINAFGEALSETSQLRLAYQPRICLRSGACRGAEALLRWSHPTLGVTAPGEFFPVIERTRLMRVTTAWVLDTVLQQQAIWRESGLDLQISINVSAANLQELDFPDRLSSALARYRVPSAALEIEVTESAIMSDPERALTVLAGIAALGVILAIDDFGTGHSSLAYLQRLPAQVVKIDQSFIRDLDTEPRKQTLVRTMIELAHGLEYRVVAEGIETETVKALLVASGCDEAQGFLFGRPMTPVDFKLWLAERA